MVVGLDIPTKPKLGRDAHAENGFYEYRPCRFISDQLTMAFLQRQESKFTEEAGRQIPDNLGRDTSPVNPATVG